MTLLDCVLMTDKVESVELGAPANLSLLANPEDLTHEDLSSFDVATTVVPLEKYIVMKAAADASSASAQTTQQLLLTSLRKTGIQQELITRLRTELKIMDELNEEVNYIALRELEGQVLQVVKYIDLIREEFHDVGMTPYQFNEGINTISSMLDDMELVGYLPALFDELDETFYSEDTSG